MLRSLVTMNVDLAYPAAFVTGAGLSASGAVLQSILRNPLAEPYLLGTVGGGALFAALATMSGLVVLCPWMLPLSSFVGSSVSLALVCLVAFFATRLRGRSGADAAMRSSGSTVVLAGFVTGSFMGSLDMFVLSYARPEDFTALTKWLYGSLALVTPGSLALGSVVTAFSIAVLLSLATHLNVLELGRDEAEAVGVNARRTIFVVLGLVALVTSVSVALAGAVGFVGLVVPHAVRRRTGPRMQRVLLISAIVGGVVLVLAELLRRIFPGDVPVGVVCAIVGAPCFISLLVSSRNGEGWDI